ncbi:PAS domain-containing sensor histidine kinase [Methanoplanus limicola]|uniref:histidine kinase n=1 Tax=Methanoplanus limicola DSM 2279 TaxID=937775 RepID=H1YXQ2_9EURY|nr:PAS domain S-box protein [Methanoplanus limicola]EHQ35021.1 multi-sensor signal transduction histidine kinase [Methanoplanus limicola DSM 2279]
MSSVKKRSAQADKPPTISKDKSILLLSGVLSFLILTSEINLYIYAGPLQFYLAHIFIFPVIFFSVFIPEKGFTLSVATGFCYLLVSMATISDGMRDILSSALVFLAYITTGLLLSIVIQEIKEKEKEIEESRKFYENLFENSPDGTIICSGDGEILFINETATKILDIKKEKILGENISDIGINPESPEQIKENNTKAEMESSKLKFTGDNNQEIWVEIYGKEIDKKTGTCQILLHNITDSVKAEEALLKSETRLRELTSQLPEVIFELDREGNFTYATRYSMNIFERSPEELTSGTKLWDVIVPEDSQRAQNNFEWFMNGRIIGSVEYRAIKPDKREVPILVHFSYIIINNEIQGLRGVALDLSQRKHIEKALRHSEKNFKTLFENSIDAIITHNISGKIFEGNESAHRLLKTGNDELRSRNILDFFPKSEKERINRIINEIKSGKSVLFESTILSADNNILNVEMSSKMIDPAEEKIQTIIRDITERKKSERALTESEKRFRNLTDLLPQTIFETDREGKITFLNKMGFRTFAINADKPDYELNITDLVCASEKEKLMSEFLAILPEKASNVSDEGREYTGVTSVNKSLPLLIYLSPIGAQGECKGVRGAAIDISGIKKAEKELRKSEQRLNLAIEGAGICVWDWNMEKDEMFFAGNYQELFRCSLSEQNENNESWREVLQLKFFSDIMAFFSDITDVDQKKYSRESRHFESEYKMKCRDGSHKWINVLGKVAEWDEQEIPTRIVGIMIDITEIRNYQNALFESNKKLNLLSSITRHDILNHLAGVKGFTDLLDKKTPEGNPELKHYVKLIRQAADNIQDQITFTRDYQNIGVKSPIWQNVLSVVNSARARAQLRNVKVSVYLDNFDIYADPMLEKIFFNLMDNAIRHGENVTKIDVTFEKNSDGGTLIFSDNGIGVPEKFKKKIFEHGFGTNTGLGLFLVKEILDITGMKITETGKEGEGARFEIRIPRESIRYHE